MQVAFDEPARSSSRNVAEEVVASEYNVAVEKTKEEQVRKAVEAALEKAGLNPNHFDSEDHIESNMAKRLDHSRRSSQGSSDHGRDSCCKGCKPPLNR